MATYAIGDLQGCLEPLQRLLDYISFDPAADRLWFVGDIVNRGPESLGALRFVRSLGDAAVTIQGNHDLYLVMHSEGFGKTSKDDTLAEILAAPDRDDLLAWLRSRPLFHAEGKWAMVHAGLLPEWSVAKAQALSDEVVAALTTPNYRDFLAHMWGSEPVAWRADLRGWDRLRVIVNAMTRMRFVNAEGAMELRAPGAKAPPDQGPPGCMPWFDHPGRVSIDHTIVCGHWSALGLRQRPDLFAIDTGCLWGGALTAVRLEDRRLYQLPCRQHVKPTDWD